MTSSSRGRDARRVERWLRLAMHPSARQEPPLVRRNTTSTGVVYHRRSTTRWLYTKHRYSCRGTTHTSAVRQTNQHPDRPFCSQGTTAVGAYPPSWTGFGRNDRTGRLSGFLGCLLSRRRLPPGACYLEVLQCHFHFVFLPGRCGRISGCVTVRAP